MSFWLSWISLWILFFIIELFLFTLDFLALWVAAVITWILIKIFWLDVSNWWISAMIFTIIWLLCLFLTRYVLLPKIKKPEDVKEALSMDSIVWEKFIVQIVNNNKVIYHAWIYWNLINPTEFKKWDTIEVLKMQWNKIKAKKII